MSSDESIRTADFFEFRGKLLVVVLIIGCACLFRLSLTQQQSVNLQWLAVFTIAFLFRQRTAVSGIIVYHVFAVGFDSWIDPRYRVFLEHHSIQCDMIDLLAQVTALSLLYRLKKIRADLPRKLNVLLLIPLTSVAGLYLCMENKIFGLAHLLLMAIITVLIFVKARKIRTPFMALYLSWLSGITIFACGTLLTRPPAYYDLDMCRFLQNIFLNRLPVNMLEIMIAAYLVMLIESRFGKGLNNSS